MFDKILIADDHVLVAEAINSLLSQKYNVIGVVNDGVSLVKKAKELKPDLIISDISMPYMNGISASERILSTDQKVKIILLTMHDELKYLSKALEIGIHGYLHKTCAFAELLNAIDVTHNEQRYISPYFTSRYQEIDYTDASKLDNPLEDLTSRQIHVLQLLAEGYKAREIAAKLNLSKRTIEFHKYKMVERLGMKSAKDLIPFAIKTGLVSHHRG